MGWDKADYGKTHFFYMKANSVCLSVSLSQAPPTQVTLLLYIDIIPFGVMMILGLNIIMPLVFGPKFLGLNPNSSSAVASHCHKALWYVTNLYTRAHCENILITGIEIN